MKAQDYIKAILHRQGRKFRAFADRQKFFWKENLDLWLVIVSALLTALSVWLAIDNGTLGDVLMQGPGAVIGLATIIIFVREVIVRWGRRHFDFYITPRPASQKLAARISLKPGQAISEAAGQALLYDKPACLLLNDGSNPLSVASQQYDLPEPLNTFRGKIFRKVMEKDKSSFNGLKVRCPIDLTEYAIRNRTPVSVQKTHYFNDRITNNIADQELQLDGDQFLNIRDLCIDEEGHLIGLEASRLSDQWGGGAFLITADQYLIYMCQGNFTAENSNKLAPAGSGSFDYEDVEKVLASKGTFQDLLRLGIYRELIEETGLKAPQEDCLMILAGFGRSLYRGGKPEAFGLVFTRATVNDLIVLPEEWDYMRKSIGKEKLLPVEVGVANSVSVIAGLEKLSTLPERSANIASGPFQFNIDLAIHWISANRSRFDTMLNDFYMKA